jgi:hypothetical protein
MWDDIPMSLPSSLPFYEDWLLFFPDYFLLHFYSIDIYLLHEKGFVAIAITEQILYKWHDNNTAEDIFMFVHYISNALWNNKFFMYFFRFWNWNDTDLIHQIKFIYAWIYFFVNPLMGMVPKWRPAFSEEDGKYRGVELWGTI